MEELRRHFGKRLSVGQAAGLELLVGHLEGHPGVEHGRPQFAPHQVVAQTQDLRCKLSSSLGGKDRGAAETCRGNKKQEPHTDRLMSTCTHTCTTLCSPPGMRSDDHTSCAPQSGVRGGQLMTGYAVFPDITGPRPLLLPATATNTVGTPSPVEEHVKY